MQPRSLALRAALFALVTLLGWLAWPGLAAPFARAFCGLNEAVLTEAALGEGSHLSIEYAPLRAQQGDLDASWNARLRLRVDGARSPHPVRLNPRRLAYLPWLLFAALMTALPLRLRLRAACFMLGSLCVLLNAMASVWLTALWLFVHNAAAGRTLDSWRRSLVDFAYEGVVTPLGNKLIFAMMTAVLLALLANSLERRHRPLVPRR